MRVTRQVVRQAEGVVREVGQGIKMAVNPKRQPWVVSWSRRLVEVSQLTTRVLEQTKARVLQGETHFKDKLLSLFEVETEAIRRESRQAN